MLQSLTDFKSLDVVDNVSFLFVTELRDLDFERGRFLSTKAIVYRIFTTYTFIFTLLHFILLCQDGYYYSSRKLTSRPN